MTYDEKYWHCTFCPSAGEEAPKKLVLEPELEDWLEQDAKKEEEAC